MFKDGTPVPSCPRRGLLAGWPAFQAGWPAFQAGFFFDPWVLRSSRRMTEEKKDGTQVPSYRSAAEEYPVVSARPLTRMLHLS